LTTAAGVQLCFRVEPERDAGSLRSTDAMRNFSLMDLSMANSKKVFYGFGHGAKTVFQFLANVCFSLRWRWKRHACKCEGGGFRWGCILRNADIHTEAGVVRSSGMDSRFELGDRAFEHLDVEIEADGFDVACC